MLIAHYDPGTFTLLELIRSFNRFIRVFPDKTWVYPVTAEHLAAQRVPAAIVSEVAPPAEASEYGKTATDTAVRQGDGTWLQVWSVSSITLAQAKLDLLAKANGLMASRIPMLAPALHAAFTEVTAALAEQSAGGTPTAARYPLVDAVAQDRGISLVQAGANVVKPLMDTWNARASLFLPKYTDIVERIEALNEGAGDTIADAKAIFDELDAIE